MQGLLPRLQTAVFCVVVAGGEMRLTAQTQLPDAPAPATALPSMAAQPVVSGARPMAMVNGRPYERPTAKDQFRYYVRDTFCWPGMSRSMVRALYGQGIGKPEGWGQDWPGFEQRFGTAVSTTTINGTVRYGMGALFKEDMRYIPCHGCSTGRKIGNAFLSEVTARHASDGHRFFTLTPIVSDFPGSIIANSFWVPDHGPLDGLVGTRLVLATRIGGHLLTEFVLERRHKDPRYEDPHPKVVPGSQPQPRGPGLQPRTPSPSAPPPADGPSSSLN
jgi:hypothetical protein